VAEGLAKSGSGKSGSRKIRVRDAFPEKSGSETLFLRLGDPV
jgi:hypothetical protein